ncbi:glycosyltransferase family 2 protein [Pediococcus claussenii]|uniref:Glycosyl transferase 2 family protein n=1 Tax=Pediococcus claussenii (strain ATCC BAA-344 / DSM 14800 / JCM 18046 / KCTC 3811 / LMG 21948 / P06) TaxID=701521 RepID=G8PBK6_PEDCP|nr:glycosyltransferase family 2 protein [Pediococcus claussenii]AEV94755.1 glycosyl transferase 2 family protein [Pediococcus claussenii ATCC BAA-344]ANZ69951.1 hypothetical protein AYR57_06330 [Pediococcus claussenii]ANZ71767.1 hypothetical protein AYR58_06330 [Pediococcus claussenii]KRN20934.1 hypothetical protein IV79_GL000159 [Pediococcus claussenii]
MTKKPLISVILPVYNAKKTLKKCIESILGQKYSNFELIIVDDGSTDVSDVICDGYRFHPKVRVFHRRRQGEASARNFGLTKANGDYISILDNHDWIAPEMLSEMQSAIRDTGSQIAVVGRYLTGDHESILMDQFTDNKAILDNKMALRELLLERRLDSLVGDKLFASKLFNEFRFPTGRSHIDIGSTYKLLARANRITHIGDPLYYRKREESDLNSPMGQRNLDLLLFSQDIVGFIKKNFPYLESEARYLYYHNLKNYRAQLSQYGAEDSYTNFWIKTYFKRSFLSAMLNRYFSLSEKATMVLARVGAYRLARPSVDYYSVNSRK